MTRWNRLNKPLAVGAVYERIPYEECPNCGEHRVVKQEQRVRRDSYYAEGGWRDWLASFLWHYNAVPSGDDYAVLASEEWCKNCHWKPE